MEGLDDVWWHMRVVLVTAVREHCRQPVERILMLVTRDAVWGDSSVYSLMGL